MQAKLYDATISRQINVDIDFTQRELVINSAEHIKRYLLEEVRFSDRLGNMPRSIYLPDGFVCETDENDTVDRELKRLKRSRGARLIHYIESHLRYAVLALITTAVFTYSFVIYGLPSIAVYVADKVPASIVYRLGDGTLATLDNMVFQPSQLDQKRQEELRSYFNAYVHNSGEWPKINIVFRSGLLGPNALALPDGTIVFTDSLVEMAHHDEELLSIFFHEIGHVYRRHALRTVLQDSAFYLVISAITGDATAASSVLATLPTMLAESNYSQQMEIEADDYAYHQMQEHRIVHQRFAHIMQRLMDENPVEEDAAMQYLSSHPATQSRIDKFNHADNVIPLH